MGADRYVPMEKFSAVATAGDAIANYIEFACPYTPVGIIAQVRVVTTGAVNVTGLAVTFATGKIKVAVTDLLEGDTVSVLAFK